jgi:hypothetical protein
MQRNKNYTIVRLWEESDIIPQDSLLAPIFVAVQDIKDDSSHLRKRILAIYFFSSAVDAPDTYLCEHIYLLLDE